MATILYVIITYGAHINPPLWYGVVNGCLYYWAIYFMYGLLLETKLARNYMIGNVLRKLYQEIKHGDEAHQKWLKDKIDDFGKRYTNGE